LAFRFRSLGPDTLILSFANTPLGAVGVEVAAEIKLKFPDTIVRLIHAHEKLLASEPLPNELKDKVLELLCESGVDLVLKERVLDIKPNTPTEKGYESFTVTLSSGRQIRAGKVINAVSRGTPNTQFLDQGLLTDDGYVNVRPT
jgi:NADH dehydrogenase FAD-containing subunit